jgi:hypothetical protein
MNENASRIDGNRGATSRDNDYDFATGEIWKHAVWRLVWDFGKGGDVDLLRPARDGQGDKHRRGERLRVLTVFEFATRRNNEVWGE